MRCVISKWGVSCLPPFAHVTRGEVLAYLVAAAVAEHVVLPAVRACLANVSGVDEVACLE